MRIEDKRPVVQALTIAKLVPGKAYRSKFTGEVFLAGLASENRPTITNLIDGRLWYWTVAEFTPVECYVVVTSG